MIKIIKQIIPTYTTCTKHILQFPIICNFCKIMKNNINYSFFFRSNYANLVAIFIFIKVIILVERVQKIIVVVNVVKSKMFSFVFKNKGDQFRRKVHVEEKFY
ncbi:MAG: hypothetical protein B7Z80_00905 [Rhodospirillales bacterium 20-64-7]|nr:MAG: hypothetical protein B7Z80_00905 [Rhodospirillales bacterium 20-64-7]